MSVSDEDLIGFALGALEPAEHARIAAALQNNPILRQRLNEIQAALKPLDQLFEEPANPPPDLADRTMAAIEQIANAPTPAEDVAPDHIAEDGKQQRFKKPSTLADKPVSHSRSGVLSESAELRSSGFRFWDSLALSASILLLASLLFPALLNGRSQARQTQCSYNMLSLANLLTQYASLAPDGRIPEVPRQGHRAFAGNYVIELHEAGLIEESSDVWCPSVVRFSRTQHPRIPSDQVLRDASQAEWELMRSWIGGNYAYNLGVVDGRCLKAPRFNGRTHFAWLGDAPMMASALKQVETFSRVYEYSQDGVSLRTNIGRKWSLFGDEVSGEDQGCEDGLTWFSHEGRGFNIVFEDGHVAFVSLKGISPEALEPFLNHAGSLQAGVEPNDSALGPSHFGPWIMIPTGISRSVP